MADRILLTGASGFIGGYLLSNENVIRCVVRGDELIRNKENFIIDGLTRTTDWSGAFDNIDVVIHLAGLAHNQDYSSEELNEINCDSVLHLASSALSNGVKRFVFVSSIGVNGTSTNAELFAANSIPNPHNAYAHSKYNAELGLKKIAEASALEVVIVRPTLVYGPNAPGNFRLLTKLVKTSPMLPFGLSKNKRDFIAVQNLADLLITCAIHPNAAGHTFLASDMETVSLREFTNYIAGGLGKKVFQFPVPIKFMRFIGKLFGKSAMIEQLVGNLQVDSSNIKEVLNWTPPLTIKQAMAALRDSGK